MTTAGAFLPASDEGADEPNVLLVGENGFQTIREAIDYARPGDIVKLAPGVYDEPVEVDKPITLMGSGVQTIYTSTLVVSSNGVTLTGHTFQNIYDNSTIHDWDFGGIVTRQTTGSGPSDSYITSLTVTQCTFKNCRQGIFLFGAKRSTVSNCDFYGCYRGITINPHRIGNTIYWNSYSNTIKDCNFYNMVGSGIDDGEAIAIFDSNYNVVDNCYMDGNSYGVAITRGFGNVVKNCEITKSTYAPLSVDSCTAANAVTISDNTFTDNGGNLWIESSSNFAVTGNTFRGNGEDIDIGQSSRFSFGSNSINGSSVFLNASVSGAIYDNTFTTSDKQTFVFTGSQGHYNHAIATSNTVGGRAIFYYYNNGAVTLPDADAGAILLAYSPNAVVTNSTVTDGDGVWVWYSNGCQIEADITNCIYGATVVGSTDVRLAGDINASSRGLQGINANAATVSVHDGEITAPGAAKALLLELGSNVSTYNVTFNHSDIEVVQNNGGDLHVYHYLDIMVWDNGSVHGLDSVEIEITTDSVPVYATLHFGGADPTTDTGGKVNDIPLLDREYLKSHTATTHTKDVTVYREIDAVWTDGADDIDMSGPLTLVFEATDIRAPAIPSDFLVTDVPDEDAIKLTWTANTDDTRLYSVYWNDSGNWVQLDTTAQNEFWVRDGLVHNTLYEFAVSALDEVPLESPRTIVIGVVHQDGLAPQPPTGLVATEVTGTTITLAWDAHLEADVEAYNVYVESAPDTWTLVDGPLSVLTLLIEDLESETLYRYAVTALDEVPNESPRSQVLDVTTLDITPPEPPVIDALPEFTNADPFTVTGTAEALSTVTVFVGGAEKGTAQADGDGLFSIDVDLEDGMNVITAWATDEAGNTGLVSAEARTTLDQVAPDMPVLDETPEITNVVSLTVTGTCEPLATITVNVNGDRVLFLKTGADGNFDVTFDLAEGENHIVAFATDRALNEGPLAQRTVVLDTIAPDAPLLDELPEYTNEAELTVTGTCEALAHVMVYAGGDLLGEGDADEDGDWSVVIELEVGENDLVATARDLATNVGEGSSPSKVILDVEAPVADAGDPIEEVESIEVTLDGSDSTDDHGIGSHVWTFTWDGEDTTLEGETVTHTFVAVGLVKVTLTVTDWAGNSHSVELDVNIISANSAPTLRRGSMDPDKGTTGTKFTFEVTFTDDDGDEGEVWVWIDGESYLMSPDPDDDDTSDGRQYTFQTKLEQGEHTYYFTGRDGVGNDAVGPSAGEDNAASTPDISKKKVDESPGPVVMMALVALVAVVIALEVRRRD